MLSVSNWLAFLITTMEIFYLYLKTERSMLLGSRLITVSGDGLALCLEKTMIKNEVTIKQP